MKKNPGNAFDGSLLVFNLLADRDFCYGASTVFAKILGMYL